MDTEKFLGKTREYGSSFIFPKEGRRWVADDVLEIPVSILVYAPQKDPEFGIRNITKVQIEFLRQQLAKRLEWEIINKERHNG